MINRTTFRIAASVFALGVATVGCTENAGGIQSVSSQSESRAAAAAAKAATKARAALVKGEAAKAVMQAEIAVAARPQDASYRALLGQAYLAAGRFASAEAALRDSLTLDAAQGKVALSLALAETAQGDWAGARDTLKAHQTYIAPADRGLAYALAGDPVLAVDILGNAARGPEADGKTRQNFALALALAGRWNEAKVVASQDMAPADVDARIMHWAKFSQPKDAADQVASLLNVTPAYDPGLPTRLALIQAVEPVAVAVSAPVIETEAAPVQVAVMDVASDPVQFETQLAELEPSAEIAAVLPAVERAVEQAVAVVDAASVTFLPKREVVQTVPVARAPLITASRAPVRVAAAVAPNAVAPKVAAIAQGNGRYVVQLGAYDSDGVAEDSWKRMARKHRVLAGYRPSSMTIASGQGATLTRLSLAGFASERDALKVCGSLKARGGSCFVRIAANDAPVRWGQPSRLASR